MLTIHIFCKAVLAFSLVPGFLQVVESFGHDAFADKEQPLEIPKLLTTREEFIPYLEKKGLAAAPTACPANLAIASEVKGYRSVVDKIVRAATTGSFKGKTFKDVAEFVDTFGARITGSESLELSIDYVEDFLRKSGATNIQSEKVTVPNWRRGKEVAKMLLPREKSLGIMGLGQTARTSILGIISDAVVFSSYDELISKLPSVRGKIVVMNYAGTATDPLDTTYNGYSDLAKAGARAVLYRSATKFSLYSVHTRRANIFYDGIVPTIPIAYLTIEDADLLTRIYARGERIRLYLNMQNQNSSSISRNVLGDLKGKEKPGEYVLWAGHVDTWDIAQGIQDDAIGVFLPLKGLQLLKSLDLTPRRTLRLAFWTAEEYGFLGSIQHIKNRKNDLKKLSAVLEADYSCLASTGLVYYGVPQLSCILQEVLNLVGTATTGMLVSSPKMRSDVDNFAAENVPVVTLLGDDGRYTWFHHTQADAITSSSVNSTEFDRCLALWTSTAYIIADLQNQVKRFPVESGLEGGWCELCDRAEPIDIKM